MLLLGPHRINGTMINASLTNSGRFGEALELNRSGSFFQTAGLVLFGTSNSPYTISMWIYPYSNTVGTLLLAWSGGWCLPLLGFTSSGILHARHRTTPTIISSVNSTNPIGLNMWTHVALSYSSSNGLRLHVNGSLVGSSSTVTTFNSSITPMTLALGHCVNSSLCSGCSSGTINMGQYEGRVDDFRLYSRQLNASDIISVMNG